jgi:hypothetical protein
MKNAKNDLYDPEPSILSDFGLGFLFVEKTETKFN